MLVLLIFKIIMSAFIFFFSFTLDKRFIDSKHSLVLVYFFMYFYTYSRIKARILMILQFMNKLDKCLNISYNNIS